MVTRNQLCEALEVIRTATKEFVQLGLFSPGVLARFEQWIKGLPMDRESLAYDVALMAGKQHSGTGADVNGVALDQKGKPSLESLVLHYVLEEESLFPQEAVLSIKGKLKGHSGPLYKGHWP